MDETNTTFTNTTLIPDYFVSKIKWGTAGGDYLKYLRKKNKLTQAALAKKLGVTRQAVNQWEIGLSYPDLSLSRLQTFCEALSVSVSDFLANYDKIVYVKNIEK